MVESLNIFFFIGRPPDFDTLVKGCHTGRSREMPSQFVTTRYFRAHPFTGAAVAEFSEDHQFSIPKGTLLSPNFATKLNKLQEIFPWRKTFHISLYIKIVNFFCPKKPVSEIYRRPAVPLRISSQVSLEHGRDQSLTACCPNEF